MNETNDQAPRVRHVNEIAPAKPGDVGDVYIGRMPRSHGRIWNALYASIREDAGEADEIDIDVVLPDRPIKLTAR